MGNPIHLTIQDSDIAKAKDFAEKVVNETYDRFHKDMQTRIDRIFYGKLGEIIFLNFLHSMNIYPDTSGMFDIYPGTANVDAFDFVTTDKKKVDIKSAYEKYHMRILIPYDQYERGRCKDYYVGIKYDLKEKKATIWGFCTKEQLEKNGKQDFGEGPAYWELLKNLDDIKGLLHKFLAKSSATQQHL